MQINIIILCCVAFLIQTFFFHSLYLFIYILTNNKNRLAFVPFATLINIHLRISEIYLRVPEWFPQGCKVKIVNYDGN